MNPSVNIRHTGTDAIDLVLQGIRRKTLGAIVYQLPGRKIEDGLLRTYASKIQFDWYEDYRFLCDSSEQVGAVRAVVSKGYDTVKVGSVLIDLDSVSGVRNTGLLA